MGEWKGKQYRRELDDKIKIDQFRKEDYRREKEDRMRTKEDRIREKEKRTLTELPEDIKERWRQEDERREREDRIRNKEDRRRGMSDSRVDPVERRGDKRGRRG